MENLMAKLEGLVEEGYLVEAKTMYAEYGHTLPENVRSVIDTQLFGMQLKRDVVAKENSRVSRAEAIRQFNALFPSLA